MLVLMRKVNEVVCIGNDVEVIVLAVKGNTVRIGINAPRNSRSMSAFRPHPLYRTGPGGTAGGALSHGCSLSSKTLSRLSWKLMLPVRCS